MENENKWEYDYSSADNNSGETGYPNVGSSGMNTANTASTYGEPAAPEAAAPEENDFQEYQPEKKMPSLLDHSARKAEPDTTGEVSFDPEDEDDGREEE